MHATTLPPTPPSLQVSADFQPFYPTLATDVFATRWLTSSGDQLFLIINRSGKDWPSLPLLEISAPVGSAVINCYSGETIIPSTTTTDFTAAAAAEAAGFACVWAGSGTSAPSSAFLSSMASLTNTPLADLSNTWVAAHTVAPPHASTPIPAQPPPGMILVPGGVFNFTTNGIEIEGPDGYGVDFQFPWENVTQRTHTQLLQMPPLWVDEYPVTNRQWSEYMNASSYVPADDTYYLAFWSRAGFNMSGDDGYRPVTWVSPQEAAGARRALRPTPLPSAPFTCASGYCAFYGRRLPHAWEWQYAASGPSQDSVYPWGDAPPSADNTPIQQSDPDLPPPDRVDGRCCLGGPSSWCGALWGAWLLLRACVLMHACMQRTPRAKACSA